MAVRSTPKSPAPPQSAGAHHDPAPALVPHGAHAGKPALPLHRPLILIGARQRAHVHLISNNVSRVHAVIINTDHGSYIRDLGSRTGTIVNGRPVKESALRHSDTISVGPFQFKFSDPTGRGPLAAAARAAGSALHVHGIDQPFNIEGRTLVIGQRDTCDIALPNSAVSTAHALVFELNGRHFIRDLGSRTGTFVNGQPIHQEALEPGDLIRVGGTGIRYATVTLDEAEVDELLPADDTPRPAAAAIDPRVAVNHGATRPGEELNLDPETIGGEDVLPAAAGVTGTAHHGVDEAPIPLEGEAPAEAEAPLPPPAEASATTDDVFESLPVDTEFDTDAELAPDEPAVPLGDPAPAVAEADSVAPLPRDDDYASPEREQDGAALVPEIDFTASPDAAPDPVVAAEEPFALTDVNLNLNVAGEQGYGALGRPVMDEFDLPPLDVHPEQSDQQERGRLLDLPRETNRGHEPPEQEGRGRLLDLPGEMNRASEPTAGGGPLDMVPLDSLEPLEVEETAEAPQPEPQPEREPIDDLAAPHETPSDVLASEVFTGDAAGDSIALLEDLLPPPAEHAPAEFVAPEAAAPEAPPEEPAPIDVMPIDLAPVEVEPASVEATTAAVEPAELEVVEAASVGPVDGERGEWIATVAPGVEEPPIVETLAAPAVAPEVTPAPVDEEDAAGAKKRRRKGLAKKPAPAPAVQKEPPAPKKKRAWGKKAREAAEAAAAAEAAQAAAAAEATAAEAAAPAVAPEDSAPPALDDLESLLPRTDEVATSSAEETLAPTEPSPESALDLGMTDSTTFSAVGDAGTDSGGVSATTSEAPPSDRAFDAIIEEFAGPSTGEIVEQPPEPQALPEALPPSFDATASEAAPPESPEIDFTAASDAAAELGDTPAQPVEMPLDISPSAPADLPFPPIEPASPLDVSMPDAVPSQHRDEPLNFDEPAEMFREPAAPATPPVADVPPPQEPPRARPAPPFDPFLGMGRDLGSFIGGMPLNLAGPDPFSMPSAPPPPRDVGRREPPARPAPSPLPDEPSLEFPLDPPPARNVTADAPELDLSLPDQVEPEIPDLPPTGATAPMGLLDQADLDLPELDAPAEEPPPAPAGKPRVDDDIDPLVFTEAEAPTLQLLPKPQPPAQPLSQPPPPERPGRPGARGQRPSHYPATPPPPARSSTPRRAAPKPAFDLDAPVGGSSVGIGIPSMPPGQPATNPHAFDGLAMSPVREADVFSGLPMGANDPVLGKPRPGAAQRPRPGAGGRQPPANVPPAPAAPQPGAFDLGADLGGGSSTDLSGLVGPAAVPAPARRGGRAPGRRADAALPAEASMPSAHPDAVTAPLSWEAGPAGFVPPPPPRRRIGVGIWIVLMLLTLGGTAAGIWFLAPKPGAEIVGTLQFERLREMGELQRQEFEKTQRDWLRQADFRGQAQEILIVSYPGVSPGFLGGDVQAVAAFEKMVDAAHVKERGGSLTLPLRGNDPPSDKARMAAVLKALHARNKPAGDLAAHLQSQYAKIEKEIGAANSEIEEAKRKATALRDKAESVPDLEGKLRQAQAEDTRLRAAAAEARREVDRLRAALNGAGSTPPEERNTAPAEQRADASLVRFASLVATPAAQPAPAEVDDQLRQWSEQLAALNLQIEAAKARHARALADAAKALDGALEKFGGEVAAAGKQLQGDTQLSAYVLAGRKMQEALRAAGNDLARRQKADRDDLESLKQRLEQKAESRLRAAWAADPELQRLEKDLAVRERHRNAALGDGLKQDAARLDGEITALTQRIETRRDLLGTGRAYADEVAELQQYIDRSLRRMEDERTANAGRMEQMLATFSAQAPAAEKLPEDQRRLAAALDARSRELDAARKAYAAALAVGDTPPTAGEKLTELQARIEARRVQLAAAQDAGADGASADKLRAELAAAEKREAEASAAADRSAETIRQLKADLAEGKDAAKSVEQAMRTWTAVEARHKENLRRAEDLKKQLATAVVPIEPGEDAVSISAAGEDRRYLYILIAGGAIVAMFSVLMWVSAHGSQSLAIPDRANPFEAPIVGQAPPTADPDDERPVAV